MLGGGRHGWGTVSVNQRHLALFGLLFYCLTILLLCAYYLHSYNTTTVSHRAA